MSQSRRRQWHPAPGLLPGKPHGWRSLMGCSPRGRYESHTTEQLHFHALEKEMATHSCVLAWRIPGTGEPGGLLSMGSQRTGLRQLSSSSSMSQIHRTGCWEGTGLEAHGQNFFGESNTLFLSGGGDWGGGGGQEYNSLLQEIFLSQGSNPDLLHCRWNALLPELPGKSLNTLLLKPFNCLKLVPPRGSRIISST